MTKMKKLFAVALAIVMLVTMSSFAAMAEATPSISISASESSVAVGDIIVLDVTVQNAGAVDFTLNFDKDVFQYVTATFTNTAVNKKSDSVKAGEGNVRVFLLDSNATLTFKAKGAAAQAGFTASKAVASNVEGTKRYDVTPTLPAAITVTDAGHIEMLGATTRDTASVGSQDLGFIGKLYNPEGKTVAKIGILAAFTTALGTNELTLETRDALNAGGTNIVAYKEISGDMLSDILSEDNMFTSHIKTTGSYELMGKNITTRFYVQFEGSEVLYSDNINCVDGVVTAENGIAKKSVVKVLGSQINKICNHPEATREMAKAAAQVIADYNEDKANNDKKQALLDFVHAYKDYLLDNIG